MIAIDEFRKNVAARVGQSFPLAWEGGMGRVVAADDVGLDLQVRGLRVRFTWERLGGALQRLIDNHTLDVGEIGGGVDAVGLVSLFAAVLGDDVALRSSEGLLRVRWSEGRPVHQYADMRGASRSQRRAVRHVAAGPFAFWGA